MIPATTVSDFDAAVVWLVQRLRAAPLGPFDRPIILAEHPAQWRAVTIGIAKAEGCAASLRVLTPDGWVEEAFGLLGARRQWRAREMRWRILDCLRDTPDAMPAAFGAAGDVNSRLEYATAVARRFRAYMRHRPEMLLQWEDADALYTTRPDLELWQRALWRSLVASDGGSSPAKRLAALRKGEVVLDVSKVPVFVLASAPLSPVTAELLALAARTREITWCAVNPDLNQLPEAVSLHACHSPLREMETCRELVAQALASDADLRPEHITLYVTDLASYLPMVDAVFGVDEPGLPNLPYSVAGRAHVDASDVPAAFLQLLTVADGRANADDIVSLLEFAAVARAAGIEANELPAVDRLVLSAGITWGLSGAHRHERFGLPPLETGTWKQGLDRLALGVATGETVVPVDGILPVAGSTMGSMSLIDRLLTWTEDLFAAFTTLGVARTASRWRADLELLLQRFVRAGDADDAEGLRVLRLAIAEQLDGVVAAAPDALLPLDGLRALLGAALSRQDRRSGQLRGGMRVCTLEPGAVLPSRVVLIAGLDDERHPQSGGSLAWDLLMHSERRASDPDRRAASLAVASEAVASAERRAHLLWTGFTQSKHEERAASVIVAKVEERLRLRDGADPTRSLVLKEPPHPFSEELFNKKEERRPWRSAATVWAQAARQIVQNDAEQRAFGDEALTRQSVSDVVTLEALSAVVTDPTRYFCKDVLNLAFNDADDSTDLEAQAVRVVGSSGKVEGHFRGLSWRLEAAAQEHELNTPEQLAVWIRQQPELPYGAEGEDTTKRLVEAWWPLVNGFQSLSFSPPRAVSLSVGDRNIVGRIDRIGQNARVIASLYDPSRSSALKYWVPHLVMNAMAERGLQMPRVTRFEGPSTFLLKPVTDAEALLRRLLQLLHAAGRIPLPLFRGAGLAWVEGAKMRPPAELNSKEASSAFAKALDKWEGSSFTGALGECTYPWHRLCWPTTRASEQGPLTVEAFSLAHEIYTPYLHAFAESP